ncbi:MAG: ribose-5-phosphate isomerase A, partial [Clostridia bacterium]|nr:ribose-5-phosphate isomerase A [Clostridia bacterium]
ADESKLVDTLGAFPLPVEIIPISLKPVTKALNDMGGEVAIRMGEKKVVYNTVHSRFMTLVSRISAE